MLLAPLSEYFGRQPVYVVSWFLLCLFQMPIALAPNIGTVLVCRFLAGLAGGAPLTNTGGSISDIWERNSSGGPMAVYGLSSTFGPPTALVMSGYIGRNAGWRWIFWTLMAITGGFWILLVVTVPETRHTIILQRKARRVSKQMRQESLQSAESVTDAAAGGRKGLHELFAINMTRPFRFLMTEPITLFSALYKYAHLIIALLLVLIITAAGSCTASSTSSTRPFLLYLVTATTSTSASKVSPSSAWQSGLSSPSASTLSRNATICVESPRTVVAESLKPVCGWRV